MIWLRLLIEYGAYPIWIYDEDGGVIDTDVPEEWQDDKILCDMLDSIQEQYESLFINTEKEFSFVGFKSRAKADDFMSLLKKAIDYIILKNNGKYELKNSIDKDFFSRLYTGEE